MTLEEQALLTGRLAKAETAYDELMTGKAVKVLVDQSGERVEFTPANSGQLSTYILELKRLLGKTGSCPGPMRFLF